MHVPVLSDTLGIAPVSPAQWSVLLLIAASLIVVMEIEKRWDKRMTKLP